ncbi:TrmH family RNA methyltransferase [Rhizosaccharibacter radicis]|uniref:RNA methyltransferase n=1 Tax=Rhizosaccharibacter radicis TaxID=2782605 RepID=A0ABT1W1L7_9PROT|nr:RNA methyltransferase [Acetobacteraceae bacterium KSS12]
MGRQHRERGLPGRATAPDRHDDRGARAAGGGAPDRGSRDQEPRERGPRDRAGHERGGHERAGRGGRSRGASGAEGYWLYGLHPVDAALDNPHRRLHRLLLTEEAQATLNERRRGKTLPLPPERVDRRTLETMLGREAVHQGMALLADPLDPPPLEQLLEQRPGPVLLLDQVTDPRNVGSILRSAAAFGAAAVVVQDRHAPEEAGVLAKAASGALEMVPLVRAVNLSRALAALKAAGLWAVGLDAGGGRLDGGGFRGRRVALVLGAEGEGLRRLTRETCDEIAGLSMPGGMESLNVSNAAAVALYELVR